VLAPTLCLQAAGVHHGRSHPEADAFFTRSTTTMLKTGNEHLQSLRDAGLSILAQRK